VVTGLDGTVQQVIGGERGFRDGGPDSAAFDSPQGMALEGDKLYVADCRNHSIRQIDLVSGQVVTVAGTGEQARRVKEGKGKESPLSSPWDLAIHEGIVYIAMAGSHNIWSYAPQSGEIARYAGSGREALADGPLARATFAQPSGLSTDGKVLYVADSESSAVRAADLPGHGSEVHTLVGQGLFEFGDVDGTGDRVRLQHDLGVCFDHSEGAVYLADSYNHKIKRLDPHTRQVDTMLGNGSATLRDGIGEAASFWEPGGLAVAAGKLYIADTNNHAIRVTDVSSLQVTTLQIRGL